MNSLVIHGFRNLVSNVGVAKGGIGEILMVLHRTRHVPVTFTPHFSLSMFGMHAFPNKLSVS